MIWQMVKVTTQKAIKTCQKSGKIHLKFNHKGKVNIWLLILTFQQISKGFNSVLTIGIRGKYQARQLGCILGLFCIYYSQTKTHITCKARY
jgi:hypothetical protein